MTTITAAEVKELRDRTNAGMMECKKALMEANGDIEKAVLLLREAGQAKAVKKAGRIAAQGTIIALVNSQGNQAVLLEINCETDFVAREERFKNFAQKAAAKALNKGLDKLESLQPLVEEARLELVATLGENISLRRLAELKVSQGVIAAYTHGDVNTARIGVLVALKRGSVELARDLAMHIAAMNPEYFSSQEIPPDRLEKEQAVFTVQTREEGKPEAMIEKIVAGKLKKFTADITLLGQAYVKDPSKTVESLVKDQGGEIDSFVRFEVGEGIEKKKDDFVAEVMAQVKGS